jgi:hypothetical protein
MRAPPHGLSQLAASFLACPRLGIPRVPLLRLTSSTFPWTGPPVQSIAFQRSSSRRIPITQIVKNRGAHEVLRYCARDDVAGILKIQKPPFASTPKQGPSTDGK